MPKKHSPFPLVSILLVILLGTSFSSGCLGPVRALGTSSPLPAGSLAAGGYSFTLDGVPIAIASAGLPSADLQVSEPGSAIQVAGSVAWNPYREFMLIAVPFDTRAPTEGLPAAEAGGKPAYENALRSFRLQQRGSVSVGGSILFFGQNVVGIHSLVELALDASAPRPVSIDEWVVEAGERLWIFRVSAETPSSMVNPAQNTPSDIVISSEGLGNPTTLGSLPAKTSMQELNLDPAAVDLPAPAWWEGFDCDLDNYQHSTRNPDEIPSYRLGAVYLGMPACGPRPAYDPAPEQDPIAQFFPGAWGVLEWECVELSMRFLYLKYEIAPYQANGNQVVSNYSGTLLEKISNGTTGQAPQPGDVLSLGPSSPWGHSSVTTASNVDASGNGSITIIEENAAASGTQVLAVSGWTVAGNAGAVIGWLHYPTAPANQAPSQPVLVAPENAVTGLLRPTNLELTLSDPEKNPMSVTFYGRKVGADFTIAVIPDSQFESASYPEIFNSMTTWIANHAVERNIVFTTHVGDIVNSSTLAAQWVNADAAMDLLDSGAVPYSVGPGNHDLGGLYNDYFGLTRFTPKTWYGGHYGSDNYSNYSLFTASGMDFILINLQYNPDAAMLDWADARLKQFSTRRGLVVSHSVLNVDNSLRTEGTNILNALKDNPNLFMILCGHMHTPSDGAAYLAQAADDGHTIHIMLSDYQEYPNGGNGYLRLLHFSPLTDKIYASTYSPYADASITTSPDQMEMAYEMNASSFGVIGTLTSVASGATASLSWTDLADNSTYEWYAVVSDGQLTTTSTTWHFMTATHTYLLSLPMIIR